jgi:uncharacterized membrane protein YdjX (TVP38/TMEM64 family)
MNSKIKMIYSTVSIIVGTLMILFGEVKTTDTNIWDFLLVVTFYTVAGILILFPLALEYWNNKR